VPFSWDYFQPMLEPSPSNPVIITSLLLSQWNERMGKRTRTLSRVTCVTVPLNPL
jgi:hypothetical protein